MRPLRELKSVNSLYGVIILGLTILLIRSWAYVVPFFCESRDQGGGTCMYEIIQDNEPKGVIFLENPEVLSKVLRMAGVSTEIRPDSCERIPCNRTIRLNSIGTEIVVDKISGPRLMNIGRKVDINVADESDFRRVPGIGPVLAQRIVAHRTSTGGFKDLEELKLVQGIREKKFASLSRYLELRSEFADRLQHIQPDRSFFDPSSGIHEQNMNGSY